MKKNLLMLIALVATCVSAFAQDTYVVAGVSALCGSNWNATDPNNQMTLQDDGTYVKTFTNVAPATNYQFKVVKNGSEWIPSGDNKSFDVATESDVNIYYNPVNNDITWTITPKAFEVNKVVVAGNGSENWLNGAVWDVNADANKMTEVADLVYEITYQNVPAGDDYQVKFALNGAWTDNFGGTFEGSGVETNANYNSSGNILLSFANESNITLRLDLSNFNYDTKNGAKMTITIENAVAAAYYLKHAWGGGEATWQPLQLNDDPKYAYRNGDDVIEWGYFTEGVYGETGCYANSTASDEGSTWFGNPVLHGNPTLGRTCRFTYFPEWGRVYIIDTTVPTAITDVKADSNRAVKLIENGQVVIVKNGMKYNVMGAAVK
ncbi:MAG: hypothetical protein Q4B68_08835 [Bacteroidales bacterium]|nr:hypothetical protein [Bacteroidales bacterium]